MQISLIRRLIMAVASVAVVACGNSSDGGGSGSAILGMTLSDDENTLYLANTYKQTIQALDLTSLTVSTYAGTEGSLGTLNGANTAARFFDPYALVNVSGLLFVADTFNQGIRKIDTASETVSTFTGTLGTVGDTDGLSGTALFNYPKGITRRGSDLYVADTSNYLIRKITAIGAVTTIAGSSGSSGYVDGTSGVKFGAPFGVAASATYVFVTDSTNNSIRSVELAAPHTVATVAGSLSATPGSRDDFGTDARFSTPAGIVSDPANYRLFVADQGNHTIRMIDLSTSPATVTTIAGAAGVYGSTDGTTSTNNGATARFYAPTGLALNAAGTILYVSDQLYTKVRKIILPASPIVPDTSNVTVSTLNARF